MWRRGARVNPGTNSAAADASHLAPAKLITCGGSIRDSQHNLRFPRVNYRDAGSVEIARITGHNSKAVRGGGGRDEKVWLGISMMPFPACLHHQTPSEDYFLGYRQNAIGEHRPQDMIEPAFYCRPLERIGEPLDAEENFGCCYFGQIKIVECRRRYKTADRRLRTRLPKLGYDIGVQK
jgi:hypothetical protein